MIAGWGVISVVLLITYSIEVLKGNRTPAYLAVFIPVVFVPLLIVVALYRKKPADRSLCYEIVVGYLVMYVFVMLTGSTSMVFSYILPLLSLLVLCHQPSLILWTGVIALLINLDAILRDLYIGALTVENSKDAEIQVALILLCFGGSYMAARLYDHITQENIAYMHMLHDKNDQIESMTVQTVTAIANALDAKDPYTEGHAERVAEYAGCIARRLNMSDDQVENLRKVARLHDIGKIGVPDSVLNKQSDLTPEEFEQMKRHTLIGAEIIKDVTMVPNGVIGARYHHERYDGSGYPDGLKGEEIPLIARIIAVADAYDAMTTNRVYRQHIEDDRVLQELERGAGTQFDPVMVDAMLGLIRDGTVRRINEQLDSKKAAAV